MHSETRDEKVRRLQREGNVAALRDLVDSEAAGRDDGYGGASDGLGVARQHAYEAVGLTYDGRAMRSKPA